MRKGDRRILYKGESFIIEVKSLQSNLVKKDLGIIDLKALTSLDAGFHRHD